MSTKDTGGPAFPVHEPFDLAWRNPQFNMSYASGMTLRDYFAAQVISCLVVLPQRNEMTKEQDANYAYIVADAMLKARQA